MENPIFTRLEPENIIKPFDCDDEDLNDFLHNTSKDYLQQLLAVTYLIEDKDQTIAFFSMLNDKVSLKDTDKNKWRKVKKKLPHKKHMSSYPAVKLGRLGVNKLYKGKGIGKMILDYLKIHFVNGNRTGCRFLTVDAYGESLGFYEKQGFIYLTEKDQGNVGKSDTRQMYYDLSQIPITVD